MKKTLFRIAIVGLVAGLAGSSPARAQTCTTADVAPRNLLASSLLDAFVNPPDREDQGFIERSVGIPNIFVLFSNSSSMRRLPPDGPASYGTLPPLKDAQCTGTGDAADPGCANALLPEFNADCPTGVACPVMGCGIDAVSSAYAGTGTAIAYLRSLTFQPPCGTSLSGKHNLPYDAAVSYAREASVCPYFVSNGTATGKDGYDPDHYCDTGTSPCAKVKFFDGPRVYHDAIVGPLAGVPADGWTDTLANPWQATADRKGIIDFCTDHYGATARQGAVRKLDICTTCLNTRGFLLDGRLLRKAPTTSGAQGSPYPSIWLTGNFLNFYPPKFIVARKVMKDIISDLRDIRMGFAQFGATGADHTANAYQELNPTCGMAETSNFYANRGSFITQLDKVTFTAGTPLARALLDLGQYYHTPTLDWFPTMSPSPGTTWNGASNPNSLSVCYACQISSVIAITDGIPAPTEGNELPVGSVTSSQVDTVMAGSSATGILPTISGGVRSGGIPTSLCSKCEAFPVAEDWKNNPARVAWYLHNLDLRSTSERTEDCMGMGGKQTLNIYTVGFGTRTVSDANTVLSNTATMGGGFFTGSETPGGLRSAITNILSQIVERATSFSVATVSTLQTTTGHSVIVPRFDPDKDSMRWKGHLSRYELHAEFLNACTETADGSGAGDLDCDGKCASVFLTDSTGAFISEDSDGIFRKNEPDAPYCIQAPLCATRGKPCGMPGTTPATPWWDAATQLDAATWRSRMVYTVVDDGPSGAPDGKIDASDTVFRLEATDAVATKIRPYLGDTAAICSEVGDFIATAGDGDTAALVRSDTTFCVKQVIRFLLGADVFNEQVLPADMWRRAATDAGQDTLPDRAFLLGDIFHSSPVVMDPPPPAHGILCPNGLHNQCLTSLWQTPVLHATTAANGTLNAYQAYAESTHYGSRRKVILVGANDGFLHAFDGGAWHGNPLPDQSHYEQADDPVTTGVDESLPPFGGYYDRGTGRELWAFLPTDMLGKVQLYLRPLRHQLFVDGSPMVRDVWVDGSSNRIGTGTADGKKQAAEFHTVAVMGERRGGTRYFALDVSDASEFPDADGNATAPRFLWMYPQPSARETVTFGETYSDFLPVGPPIGPVRIEADSTSGVAIPNVTPTMAVQGLATPVPYHERWVAFLSGGFDPMYLRGRGVHMVDVWTGAEVFDFSYPDDSASVTAGDPRLELRFPVAATVGMVMWGQGEQRLRSFENEGYFDTATFGDTGGQLWAVRFSRPGRLDPTTRKVTNWFGGRIMSMPDCANQPFFYITGNVAVRQGYYRVVAGTGDRYNLLDLNGGDCDPDNPRACAQRGCTVTMTSGSNQAYADGPGSVSRAMTITGGTCGITTSSTASTSVAACTAGGSASMQISCPGSGGSTTRTVTLGCTLGASGYTCAQTAPSVATVAPTTAVTQGNWYVSLRVFHADGARPLFSDLAGASEFDRNRLQVSAATGVTSAGIVVIDGADGATLPNPLSTYGGKGWALRYNHGGQVTVADHIYNVNLLDERTSSTSAVYGGVYWNTTQPTLGSVSRVSSVSCTKSSKCVAEGRRVTYHYGANVETGGPVLLDASGQLIRSVKNVTLVPAMGDQPTVFVNQQGQIQVGLTAVNPERGATNVFAGQALDPLSEYGTVEVSRDAHACRHAATQADAAAVCP